ncbi:MAG: MBL fold metallo-hydrolase [Chitinophagaceae bacterium]
MSGNGPYHITFLGTGTSSGVPMIACPCDVCASSDPRDKRLRSSVLVETAQTTIVIDTTPDFRYQMLRANVRKLDGVVITHSHKDHIAGMDDVRAFNYFMKRAMPVYSNDASEEVIMREFPYAFADKKYPGVPEIELVTIGMEAFTIGDIELLPVMVWHMRMPVWGFRIGDFTYITDANKIDAPEKEKILGSKVLVLNALRREKHISHFNLEEAIALVQELNVPTAYFTHISHQLGTHEDVSATLPEGIHLAYDGLKITV